MIKNTLILFILSFYFINYNLYSQNTLEEKAQILFDNYVAKIEKSNNLIIRYSRIIKGDINNDNLTDIIIEFGLGIEDANSIIEKQAAIYINKNNALKVVTGFQPNFCMNIKEIDDNLIIIDELEACSLPWPKTVKTRFYKFFQNQLMEIEPKNYKETNENILLQFETIEGKKLVISIEENQKYIIYRYGTSNNIELEFPNNLKNSWDKFSHSWYLRGGGIQNEGMDLDYLYFEKDNFKYVVFQEYYSKTKKTEYGIKVINLKTNKVSVIKANPKTINGTLSDLREINKIKKGDKLF